jgi:large subunit ribosomal protein L9
MKVVFIEEVPGTAVPGEVKDVKDGFARNYLLPRKLAVPATKATLQRADALSKREEKRQAQLDGAAQRIVDKLEGQQILIRARVGEQGRLYGSVTAADIAARLDEILGEPIDRRRINMPVPIREVGTRQIPIRLTRNVSTAVEVVIEADETSTRGRRSSAPAGGSILMSPVRERERRRRWEDEEDEDEFETRPSRAEAEAEAAAAPEGETAEDDEMVTETESAETDAIEGAQSTPS